MLTIVVHVITMKVFQVCRIHAEGDEVPIFNTFNPSGNLLQSILEHLISRYSKVDGNSKPVMSKSFPVPPRNVCSFKC